MFKKFITALSRRVRRLIPAATVQKVAHATARAGRAAVRVLTKYAPHILATGALGTSIYALLKKQDISAAAILSGEVPEPFTPAEIELLSRLTSEAQDRCLSHLERAVRDLRYKKSRADRFAAYVGISTALADYITLESQTDLADAALTAASQMFQAASLGFHLDTAVSQDIHMSQLFSMSETSDDDAHSAEQAAITVLQLSANLNLE